MRTATAAVPPASWRWRFPSKQPALGRGALLQSRILPAHTGDPSRRALQPGPVSAKVAGVFGRYSLRTTDLDSAREFYLAALGLALPNGASSSSSLEAWPLHERARARGAPPHWLGHILVDDLDSMLDQMLQRGSEPLGPTVSSREGIRFATLRDPFGAVLALRQRGDTTLDRPVAWHQLHTLDASGSLELYTQLFGWAHQQTIDGPDAGGYQLFSWGGPGEAVGFVANTARRAGIHVHWLFHFPVPDIEASVARVRALGGTAQQPCTLKGRLQLAACEDPQGAAFGLSQA